MMQMQKYLEPANNAQTGVIIEAYEMIKISRICLALFTLCLPILMLNTSLSATSDIVLAARATKLYNAQGEGPRGERYFRVSLIVDEILEKHAKSYTALRIRKNKFQGFDVAELRMVAERWERAYPDKALKFREDPALLRFSADGRDFPPPSAQLHEKPYNEGTGSTRPDDAVQAPVAPPAPLAQLKAATTTSTPIKFRRGQLAEVLKSATVLVITLVKKGGRLQVGGHGTGFFINQSQILTNAHVARGGEAFVIASKVLGIGHGEIAAYGQTKSKLGIDAAVINVKGITPTTPLVFSADLIQGDTISLAGYPGVIEKTDDRLTKLFSFLNDHVKPSRSIVPSLRITDTGVIEAIFDDDGIDNLQYTMETTQGNSGSPVVNACAQIVGLHFSGVSDKRNNSKYNFGHSAVHVRDFLDSNGIKYAMAEHPCDQG